MNSAWRYSPREVDLLSWFTGPLVPLVFGGTATAFGIGVTSTMMHDTSTLIFEYLAVLVMVVAFCSVMFLAPARRANLKATVTIIPIAIGWFALLLSVANEWGSTVALELRWSPIAFALLLASLAPYLSAARILTVGITSAVAFMGVTALSVTAESRPDNWPFVVQLFFGSGMILVATAASTVFCYQVVARTIRWAQSVPNEALSSGVLGEAARRRILRHELASVSDRVLPLLERVTASGVVSDMDREEARSLSESLRAELVERSNLSWLESLTRQLNLTVIDHDRLAEQMNLGQRSALLGLLTAATRDILEPTTRVVVELRGETGGATAVAISADQALPEGRKLTLLAPHYVSLATTVDDMEWETGERLHMSFRVPARTGQPDQRPEPPIVP